MLDQFNMEISPCAAESNDTHYDFLSQKYRTGSIYVGIITGVLVLLMLLFGYKEFTYENVFYFIKDFDVVISSGNYDIDHIEYGTGENRKYYSYRGGVVTAGKYDISVYSSTGRKTATFNDEFVAPNICSSSKYILAYDTDGKTFSVYNSFLRLYSETMDEGIEDAYTNDRGDFLIHTSTPEYKSVVYHYDNDFKRIAAYYFVDYAIDSFISADGKFIYIATVNVENGNYVSSVNVYKAGADKIVGQYNVQGAVPLGVFEIGSGCCILTDRSVLALNESAETLWQVELDENSTPYMYASSNKGLVLATKDNGLMFVSPKGEKKTVPTKGNPIAVDVHDMSAYILYDGTVIKHDFSKNSMITRECPPEADDILILSDGVVYLCYSTRAICCEF